MIKLYDTTMPTDLQEMLLGRGNKASSLDLVTEWFRDCVLKFSEVKLKKLPNAIFYDAKAGYSPDGKTEDTDIHRYPYLSGVRRFIVVVSDSPERAHMVFRDDPELEDDGFLEDHQLPLENKETHKLFRPARSGLLLPAKLDSLAYFQAQSGEFHSYDMSSLHATAPLYPGETRITIDTLVEPV